ncbi:MAG: hypothetical protein ABI442_08835 [Gemmatimonadaceae bacterium]
MRRIALLLVLCGCASAGTPEDSTPRQAKIFQSAETGTLLGEAPRASKAELVAPPATVWLAAKQVYSTFDIPVAVDNPAAHQLGNANFFKARQMAGKPMTQWVDCGSGMDGPKASSYRIYMSLLTTVVTDGKGGTTVQTTFVPFGQDMSGSSSDRIPCATTGKLESLFLEKVTALVSVK